MLVLGGMVVLDIRPLLFDGCGGRFEVLRKLCS
jgi:hypothetical protein